MQRVFLEKETIMPAAAERGVEKTSSQVPSPHAKHQSALSFTEKVAVEDLQVEQAAGPQGLHHGSWQGWIFLAATILSSSGCDSAPVASYRSHMPVYLYKGRSCSCSCTKYEVTSNGS